MTSEEPVTKPNDRDGEDRNMSIRIKIAKWLAPNVFDSNDVLRSIAQRNIKIASQALNRELKYARALHGIASLRTPSCAHIGKRMADIADAALKTKGDA